ncbi:MAG TPA: VOC family protein [Thermomicrobiales bacterium]|jgi:hypothetical protein|nr:VOC family protein [Thermomicrobiales bacterium]
MAVAARSFAHIGLTVSDLDQSVRFWTEVLGFELGGTDEVGGAIQNRITAVPEGRARIAMVTGVGVTFELV